MTSLLSPARLATRRYLSLSLSTPLSASRSYSDRAAVSDIVNQLQSDPLLAHSPELLPPKPTEPSLPPVTRFPIANAPTPEEIVAADALAAHRAKLYGNKADPLAHIVDAQGARTRRPPPEEPKGATVPFTEKDLPQKSDPLLDFFVNLIMRHGMKTKATIILHMTLNQISLQTSSPPIPIFKAAILKAAPFARIRSSKKGAKITYMPIPLTERQRVRTGIMWIIQAADKRPMTSVDKRIAAEVLAVLSGDSPVLKRLDERHKVAMVNRSNLPRTLGPLMIRDVMAAKKST
ncbi:ribosomal protein S7 domain-containing protein [Mrakia frigida]|uniref:mitochondrial 37S ribosomal protein uS7m RSM7 n=1 Tax=Mrakia frigida TaxID=29902 RepID=UPI003FCC212B